jgi:hypothetical protein
MAFLVKGQLSHHLDPSFVKLYHYLMVCVKFALFLESYCFIRQMTKQGYINKIQEYIY